MAQPLEPSQHNTLMDVYDDLGSCPSFPVATLFFFSLFFFFQDAAS